MCVVSASVNNDPLSSVKNSADDALNEHHVNRLKAAEHGVLPKPILGSSRVALFDYREEQCLRFLEVELRCCRYIDLQNSLKFPQKCFEYHIRLLVFSLCIAVHSRLILIKGCP